MTIKSIKSNVNVIDDKLILSAINTDSKKDNKKNDNEVGNIIEIAQSVDKLILSFKNIIKIENLNGFDRLIKLCLDNNNIEEITNLNHLVSLKWLDLSFNKIRKIQGLDQLIHLEDLSLYANKITTISGLENLKKIQCLSLGNNRIDSLDQVIKLRNARQLNMLTLANNPVCNEMEYKMVILAYIDTLKYLDYALIDPNEYRIAKEQYHDELLDIEEKESVIAEKYSRDKALDIYLTNLNNACILFSYTLIDELVVDDADLDRLRHLPGAKELVEQMRVGFKAMSDEFIANALERYQVKSKEIDSFEMSIGRLRATAESESSLLIANYNKERKEVAAVLTNPDEHHAQAEKQIQVKKLHEQLDVVCDKLMSIELRLIEKFDAMVDEFDNKLMELKNLALEHQQLYFRGVEELENKFSTDIRLLVQDLIDRLAREEFAEDYLDDDAMGLIVDKDTCLGLVNASHDAHVSKILKREDEARNSETKRYQDFIQQHIRNERARNRDRVLQIHNFSQNTKGLSNALLFVDDEEQDEDR